MPDDNPYAAPQTIKPQQVAAPLPVAEGRGDPQERRRFFYDWETTQVRALWERSRAIYDMQVVWLVLCFIVPWPGILLMLPLLIFGSSGATSLLSIIGLSFMLLTFVRFGTGFARTEEGRAFALAMDGLLGLACVAACAASIFYAIDNSAFAFQTVFVLPIAALVGFQTVRSMRAMLQAPELFGPAKISHESLCDEVEYRREHQID